MSPSDPAPGPAKAATGIAGFDALTHGGLPRGRATLVAGGAGSGKTLFAVEFLARGAYEHHEPGVMCSFEESRAEVVSNARSLGLDLDQLIAQGLLALDAVRMEPGVVTAGEFDLDGLLVRLDAAITAIGARRLVLDTVEVMFAALGGERGSRNAAIIRAELGRLLRWAKDRELTVVITGESGSGGTLTRYGIEEYVSDCVVLLDSRLQGDIATRRLRVAKYRGSEHGTNAYPFLITGRGINVLPLSELDLSYRADEARIGTGIAELDDMLGGGLLVASALLVTGSAGTGKTSVSAHVAAAAAARGDPALFVTFEESPDQLVRNMRSIGIDLQTPVQNGLLTLVAARSTQRGLEGHLAELDRLVRATGARTAVFDGIGSLRHVGTDLEVAATLARLVDLCRQRGVTSLFTELGNEEPESAQVSSLMDGWLLLRNLEQDGERNRLLFVIKNRGSAHSNQVREFVLTDHGARLEPIVVGPNGVLVGSARAAQRARDEAAARRRERAIEDRRAVTARKAHRIEERIARLQTELAARRAELDRFLTEQRDLAATRQDERRPTSRLHGSGRGDDGSDQ